MPTFSGRVEAMISIPTGGVAVSASNGAWPTSAAPIVVTIPAGDYFLSEDGNLDGLLATLQTQLNNNVQGYPVSAAGMQAAVGYGTWSAGWLFNIASGNDGGAFGGVTMTAVSSPTYGTAGPRSGIDLAIGFDSAADAFSAGDNFDVTATDDICIAWVGYLSANPAGTRALITKYNGTTGWFIKLFNTGEIQFGGDSTVPASSWQTDAGLIVPTGSWHVGIACVDRSTGKARIGIRTLAGSTTTSAEATATAANCSNASNMTIGQRADLAADACTEFKVAGFYIGTGTNAATGLSANLSTALTNFANAINAAWTVSKSSTTGLVTISNSFWPSSAVFGSATLRDLLGFAYDYNAPATAAQMATALGYGTWTSGAGYLCNESSGNLSAAFGTPATLTAVSTPTYSNQGARGGADTAVGFDSAADAFSGGDVFDVTGTDDLIVVWVGRVPSAAGANYSVISKYDGVNGWQIYLESGTGNVRFQGVNGGGAIFNADSGSGSYHGGKHHVGIAVIDRSTGKARVGTYSLTDGTATISSETTTAATSTAGTASFRLGDLSSAPGTAPIGTQLSAVYVVSGSGVATGLSANLSTALSNFASYMKSQTGTKQARGLWFPDCPIFLADSDPRLAPINTAARSSVQENGEVITFVSATAQRIHRGVRWSHVPIDRIREQSATYANASWLTFWDDTQLCRGLSYFKPSANLLIIDHAGNIMGSDMHAGGPTYGWQIPDPYRIQPKRADPGGWSGLWTVEIPELIARDE